MKKIVSVLLAVMLLVTAFCSCGKSETAVDPAALANDVLQNCRFTDSLNPVDGKVAVMIHEVDEADVADVLYYGGTGATADEITVFTAVDESAAGRILAQAQSYVAKRIESFKNYGPEGALMLENAIVRQSGKYVVIVVCGDGNAPKIVDKYIK